MIKKQIITYLFFLLLSCYAHAQTITSVHGIVRDSISGEALSYVTIRFDETNIGNITDDAGRYRLQNRQNKTTVIFSLIGYRTKTVTIPAGKDSNINMLLIPEGIGLDEIVIRPGKERYSKKSNPAIELIRKVIEHKEDYRIANQDYYNNSEYERLLFAFNEFDPNHPAFKNFNFLTKYETTSLIDEKPILPFSVRETLSDVYYRKSTNQKRKIIKAYHLEGLDQTIDPEALNSLVKETFTDIDITDNNINFFFRDFVGPLSSTNAIDFYKWYIIDTVDIDNKKFINLGFVPFNTRDIGFSGNLYITADTTYALKRLRMRVPAKTNLNFIESMIIEQEFEQLSPDLWIPSVFTTAIEFALRDMFKVYVEKVKTYDNFTFNHPVDAIFFNPSPEIYLEDYDKHDKSYWQENRPKVFGKDYKIDNMMNDLASDKFIHFVSKAANIISSGYIATSTDPEKNKVDLGTVETFYSYNNLEGNRLRLTAATTSNFHKHLFLYGYMAYGFKDGKPKYMGEVTWSFSDNKKQHKDVFPVNNLSISYKYDVTALGQKFLQTERDNILLSIGNGQKNAKLTYDRAGQVSYQREYYNGFSFNLFGITHNQRAAMNILFEKPSAVPFQVDTVYELRTTEAGLLLRYAPNEKIFQRRRSRGNLPSKGFIYTLSFAKGFDNLLRGQYNYTKLALSVDNELWISPYGKLNSSIQAEKIWGQVPYPLLLSSNVNNSITVQTGSFYMLKPLEFISDQQVSWNVTYKMGGWLFNRIPLIKEFKWREVLEFRGFLGSLSARNNPLENRDLMFFPADSYSMGKQPYMEFSAGIGNILRFFRVDYVRRLNYLNHPGINKDGFRVNLTLSF